MTRNVSETHKQQLHDLDVAAAYLTEALEQREPDAILMALHNTAEAWQGNITPVLARAELDRNTSI